MLTKNRLVLAAILASATLAACVGQNDASSAQIRSTAELEAYLQITPSSPLNKLSPEARQRFTTSLVFTAKGLGSYDYSDLKALSGPEVYEVLSLFGAQSGTALISKDLPSSLVEPVEGGGDHDGYRCEGVGTCTLSAASICTSNC
jgi:hypothetical protein